MLNPDVLTQLDHYDYQHYCKSKLIPNIQQMVLCCNDPNIIKTAMFVSKNKFYLWNTSSREDDGR